MPSHNNEDPVIVAFQYAASTFPFYKDFLQKHSVSVESVRTRDDFETLVPCITKEDIFPVYPVEDLCQQGNTDDIVSAIVSSGTTGIFSYGLLTEYDVVGQKHMFDTLMQSLFHADALKPIIINALPMGVSFVSSYPVIPTSVRTDIVLEVIKTLQSVAGQFIIVTDPHVLKKIVEEGVDKGFPWSSIQVSGIVGGTSFSDSYVEYIEQLLNGDERDPLERKNHIFGTMGVTEVGLNIFGSTPDLHMIRHQLQTNEGALHKIFGARTIASPEIMYIMSGTLHVEICNPDEDGVGDVVISHLDTQLKTMLIRYKTGDRGKMVESEDLVQTTGITPRLPFPLIAIFDRFGGRGGVSPLAVKELLYRDHDRAQKVTGHFVIENDGDTQTVRIQLKPGVGSIPSVPFGDVMGIPTQYADFPRDIEVSYENKWRHIL